MIRSRLGSSALLLALVALACAEQPRPEAAPIAATVERVVDGDTAWFTLAGGTREKVRFIGVDAPESTAEHEPFGNEATAHASSVLTPGRQVFLELDVDERDRYGRLLAYVWLSDPGVAGPEHVATQMLNGLLLRDGFATLLTVPPNVTYVDAFAALQREARTAGRGLWADR